MDGVGTTTESMTIDGSSVQIVRIETLLNWNFATKNGIQLRDYILGLKSVSSHRICYCYARAAFVPSLRRDTRHQASSEPESSMAIHRIRSSQCLFKLLAAHSLSMEASSESRYARIMKRRNKPSLRMTHETEPRIPGSNP